MTSHNEYSKEWLSLYKSAKDYRRELGEFFSLDHAMMVSDLREALKDLEAQYYALRVIEDLSHDLIEELLEDLMTVAFYSNVSNAYLSKRIILDSNRSAFRDRIHEIIQSYSENGDDDLLKDLALFLFELRFKKELVLFVEKHLSSLKESEFIEGEEDLREINELKDWDAK